jgi:hypothetical protein
MKTLLIIGLLFLVSCGQDEIIYETKEIEVEKEVEVEVEVEKIIEVAQKFEGFYDMSENSFIELVANARGDITVESTNQTMSSKNTNGTYGEHPRIVGTDLQIINDRLKWSRNENYTSGHDLEADGTNNNISGTKRTDYTIELIDGKIHITIQIWQDRIGNNINNIIATRTWVEL